MVIGPLSKVDSISLSLPSNISALIIFLLVLALIIIRRVRGLELRAPRCDFFQKFVLDKSIIYESYVRFFEHGP